MSTSSHYKSSDLFDVSFLTAVVTGGGTGIGLMISQALAANGAKVYITGRRAEVLEDTIKAHNSGPGSLNALSGDVSTKEGCLQLAKDIEAKEPKGIQLLVNNAGIARDDATKFSENGQPDMKDPEAISKHFLNSETENWDDTFRTNVTAQFFLSMACLPLLAKGAKAVDNYSSQIVNVSSISGQLKSASGGQFSYGSSKAASTHLSRMLATTLKETGIRVNIIAPGIFPSEMTTGKSDENNKSKIDRDIGNPAGRAGLDSDMAATILFLAGRGGLFFNEQTLYPDGGATLASPAAK